MFRKPMLNAYFSKDVETDGLSIQFLQSNNTIRQIISVTFYPWSFTIFIYLFIFGDSKLILIFSSIQDYLPTIGLCS